jgi:predicted nucleic acid-binding protein
MKYLFDTSAIFKAIQENKINLLIQNYTIELTRYELGNILWKNFYLHEKATTQEIEALSEIIKQTLNLMKIIQIECTEQKILETATKQKITFYDASFTYHAKLNQLTLVTEDIQLQKKVEPYIKTINLDNINQKTKNQK